MMQIDWNPIHYFKRQKFNEFLITYNVRQISGHSFSDFHYMNRCLWNFFFVSLGKERFFLDIQKDARFASLYLNKNEQHKKSVWI